MIASQNIEKSPSGMYGIAGDFFINSVERTQGGVAVSKNGGKDFEVFQASKFLETDAWIRYGTFPNHNPNPKLKSNPKPNLNSNPSPNPKLNPNPITLTQHPKLTPTPNPTLPQGAFPSEDVWYLAAGGWPVSKTVGQVQLTDRIFVDETTGAFSFRNESLASAKGLGKSGNSAEILKTTDGGLTFTSVFTDVGSFYFNGIHCASEDVCMVVAEGNGAGTVYGTQNGGETWEILLKDTDGEGVGLFQVRMISELEAWAVGGNLVRVGFEARFHHTVDGGATWTVDTVPQVYATSLTMPSSNVGYATGLTPDSQSSLLAFGV